MPLRIAIPDMISPSYFPAIAAVELGFFEQVGLDATIELLYPVGEAYSRLRAGELDYVGGAAHAALHAFDGWAGCQLLCALSQHMYWFLVVRADLPADRGDLSALRGLRIGAAPGPVDGLRAMVASAGLDPDADVDIGPVPGATGESVSFGVTAAEALENGAIDGFWANGMGKEVATEGGFGKVLIDARRGDGPDGTQDLTFAALVATSETIAARSGEVAAATRAIMAAQGALRADPGLAEQAAAPHFPDYERGLIARLIERDAVFYDPRIPAHKVDGLNRLGRWLGLLDADDVVDDDVVVSTVARQEWI